MTTPKLYLGNKNYSSWSMRPWLALRWGGIAFEEQVLPLGGMGYGKSKIPEILAVSPSGRVPALHGDGVVIYDSLAICEWAHERAPHAGLWPADPIKRALARSAAAEMHSGFPAVRRDLSMNLRRKMTSPPPIGDDARHDLDRLFELWTGVRAAHGADGGFLFGARGIVDAMYAPIATRLRTYAIPMPVAVQIYCDAIFADPDFKDWEQSAIAETWSIEQTEELYR